GQALKEALHEIIDDHVVKSYDFAWTAYRTADVKPNGKVWDIYSDTAGEQPPYEYDFGVNEGGIGGSEGKGYTHEHSWPKSWFGGT
ncbi:endonuclease, partial [Escherichia coli]|uniref:endonuclease n=1 Tax=Escherichia coli TaxID=562 RepID=UPI0028DD5A62